MKAQKYAAPKGFHLLQKDSATARRRIGLQMTRIQHSAIEIGQIVRSFSYMGHYPAPKHIKSCLITFLFSLYFLSSEHSFPINYLASVCGSRLTRPQRPLLWRSQLITFPGTSLLHRLAKNFRRAIEQARAAHAIPSSEVKYHLAKSELR